MSNPTDSIIEAEGSVAITQREALEAARNILARGVPLEEISLRKVKKELGGRGTLVTIGKALETLRAELAAKKANSAGGGAPATTPEAGGSNQDKSGLNASAPESEAHANEDQQSREMSTVAERAMMSFLREELRYAEEVHRREMVLVEQRGDERVKAARAEALLTHLRWSIPVLTCVLTIGVVVAGVGGFHLGQLLRPAIAAPIPAPTLAPTPPNEEHQAIAPVPPPVSPEVPGDLEKTQEGEGGKVNHTKEPTTPDTNGAL